MAQRGDETKCWEGAGPGISPQPVGRQRLPVRFPRDTAARDSWPQMTTGSTKRLYLSVHTFVTAAEPGPQGPSAGGAQMGVPLPWGPPRDEGGGTGR